MNQKKYLIVISGPTAVGKTKLTVLVAKLLECDIISADSRQFYKEMTIGTAKPSLDEQAGVKHHFISNMSIEENYNIGKYERDGTRLIEQIFQNKNHLILTGGSGMYIRAITEGLDDFPDVPRSVFDNINNDFKKKGITYLQEQLKERDPLYYNKVDLQNHSRLIRALAVCEVSNKSYSHFLNQEKKQRNFVPVYILLSRDRNELYERINHRVDLMMAEGLLDEVKKLERFKEKNALQTVGYKELFDFLDGSIDLETATDLIKRNSRRYAKRQLTWFRKRKHWKSFHPDNIEEIMKYIKQIIRFDH